MTTTGDDLGIEPDQTVRMGDIDALLWAIERDPRLASTVVGVAVFEPVVDADEVERRVERVSRLVPRLRQRVVGNPASLSPPRWELDPHFDLANHFAVIECPGAGTMADALARAATASTERFDRDHPLWQFTLVQNVDGNRSVLIMKAHHAIADGMGLLSIQIELFDFEPDGSKPDVGDVAGAAPLSAVDRLINALTLENQRAARAVRELTEATWRSSSDVNGLLARAVDTLGSAVRSMQPVKALSPVMTERSDEVRFETLSVSLSGMKTAAKQVGCRMNAAFVAGAANGMYRYHQHHGADPARLRMGMPVSNRSATDAAPDGNFFAPVRLELPLTADEPSHLIEIVQALVNTHRDEPALDLLGPAANLMVRLPAPIAATMFGRVLSGTDFLTSNIPGSPLPIWLAGSAMVAQFPYGPLSTSAVNLTLLSYLDEAHIGVTIDTGAVTDVDALMASLRDGFDWVLSVD